jgi:hydroxypyruvate isomerase
MLKFAANLSFLYQEHAFLDRFVAAARDGFEGVEYLFPYEFAAAEVAAQLREHRLTQVLFNIPAGNWPSGERGIACLPERRAEFRDGVALAIEYARALGCTQLNCLAGRAPANTSLELLQETFVANLQFAAAETAKSGIRLLLEPINTRDVPNFFVSTTAHAEQILAAVGSSNLFIQYDAYHMQIMQGDLVPTLERLLPRISHIQIADTPGRHEPGTGEINYAFVLAQLVRLGYRGWVGCEYTPQTNTSAGLIWMRTLTGMSEGSS